MSQDQIADTKSKLDDLEQRIHAAKSSLGAKRRDQRARRRRTGTAMVEKHGDLRRKLDASDDHPARRLEGLDLDVDVLRTSLETWMAKVEGNFDKSFALLRAALSSALRRSYGDRVLDRRIDTAESRQR